MILRFFLHPSLFPLSLDAKYFGDCLKGMCRKKRRDDHQDDWGRGRKKRKACIYGFFRFL